MSIRNSIKVNIIYNMLYQILLMITPLITSPYVSRILGTQGIGVFSYTYSLASCFAMVGLLGVTNYGNRMIASVQHDKKERSIIFWNILSVQAIISLLVLVIYLIYVMFGRNSSSSYKMALLIQALTVACSVCDINWYFFGVEKFKLTVTRNTIIKIFNVILIFILVKKESDVNMYIFILAGSLFLSNLLIWPFMRDEVDFIKPDFKIMVTYLKPLFILFIPIIAITLYNRMDKVMIGMLSNINQTGLYENAEKIINVPKSMITALGTVMLPRMTNLYATGEIKSADSYIERTMEFTFILASAMMFGIMGVSQEFAPYFFGEEFSEVVYLLIIIAPTIFFVSWANVIRTQYLIPLKYDKIYVISVWLGALANLIINFKLIPIYGAIGAVIGTVIAEFIVMFYQTFMVRKQLDIIKYIKNGLYYIFVGIGMYIVIRLVSHIGDKGFFTIFMEFFTGGIFYIGLSIPYFMKQHGINLYNELFVLKKKIYRK